MHMLWLGPLLLFGLMIYSIPTILNALFTIALGIILTIVICFVVPLILPKKVPIALSLTLGLAISTIICLGIEGELPKWSEKPESMSSVSSSMIGTPYSGFPDGSSSVLVEEGDVFELCFLTVIDDQTLNYEIGDYRFHRDTTEDNWKDWESEWIAESIHESGTSSYKLSYNYITGKTMLKFDTNNQQIKCELCFEDGQVVDIRIH